MSVTTKINQKEYLKKYLSSDIKNEKKKKKKRKEKNIGTERVKIIDDDVQIHRITDDELDIYATGEDAPQIVGFIDDRPVQVIADEYYKNQKWKGIGNDDDELNSANSNVIAIDDQNKRMEKSKTTKTDKIEIRIKRENTPDNSPPRRQSLHHQNDDLSPQRRYDSRSGRTRDSDRSPTVQHRNSRYQNNTRKRNITPDISPPRRQRKRSRSSDLSPPRRQLSSNKHKSSDLSPPRRSHQYKEKDQYNRNRTPDLSPHQKSYNRKTTHGTPSPPPTHKHHKSIKSEPNASPPSHSATIHGKLTKTLDGKIAGLQDARQLVLETEMFRKREDETFNLMSAELSGRNANVIRRDHRTGRIRDLQLEAEMEERKNAKEKEKKELYDRWGKGLKQVEDYNNRIANDIHEMNKPLARYSDDKDLDELLKQQERIGDPMLEYLRNKNKDQNLKSGKLEKPLYAGTYPDNRFSIRPGYRWDGVDRSNGFEVRWFEMQSKRKAGEEEAYKYSTEDM